MSPTTRTPRTPTTGTSRSGRVVPTRSIGIIQWRDATWTVVNIRQNNDGQYIYVFSDDWTPIPRPRWTKRTEIDWTSWEKRDSWWSELLLEMLDVLTIVTIGDELWEEIWLLWWWLSTDWSIRETLLNEILFEMLWATVIETIWDEVWEVIVFWWVGSEWTKRTPI